MTPRWRNVIWGYLHGTSLPYWQEALKDENAATGEDAIAAFAKTGSAAIPTLIESLHDSNALVRERAAEALSRMGKSVVPQLVIVLKDDDPLVRAGGARALAHMGPEAKDAVPALIERLDDEQGFVRSQARNALNHVGAEAVPALQGALKSEDQDVRFRALMSLKDIGPPAKGSAAEVGAHLSDKNMAVRILAAETLYCIGAQAKAAVPDLSKVVEQSGYRELRVKALHALSHIDMGNDKTILVLVNALRDQDDMMRMQSALELGVQGPRAKKLAAGALHAALKDANVGVQANAAAALRRVDFDWAAKDLEDAATKNPKDAQALNDLAWFLATCPEAKFRDGKKAVENAKKACEMSGFKNEYYLDTLAAAHAENKSFDEAVRWQTKVVEALVGPEELGPAKSRLKLYQQAKPYRDEE
jgi:HEAT repeat protein